MIRRELPNLNFELILTSHEMHGGLYDLLHTPSCVPRHVGYSGELDQAQKRAKALARQMQHIFFPFSSWWY